MFLTSCQKKVVSDYVTEGKTTKVNSEDIAATKEEYTNRLTGLACTKSEWQTVPVAVMYSNIKDAMPQSSISYADVVFESKVEGGITRMCCLFNNKPSLTKIGPVRSCRTYYLLFAKEFEAVYVHFGASEYAEKYLAMNDMHALDGMSTCDFYRSDDRVAPHNAYTSWTGIMNSVKDKQYPVTYPEGFVSPFKFNLSGDSRKVPKEQIQSCKKFYPGFEYNEPWFSYDEKTGQYLRYQFGEPEIDAENDKQISFSNILVKFVEPEYYPNNTPNYKIDGTGKGLFISNGFACNISWSKDSDEEGPTKYYYSDGQEIELTPGKTYVALIETTQKSVIE